MDIQTAHSLIWDYLLENDSYAEKSSYKLLNWQLLNGSDKLNESECQAAVSLALNSLVEDKILEKTEYGTGKNKETIYIAVKSLRFNPVTIELSKQTADAVAEVVNSVLPFATLEKLPERKGKNIGEQDIVLLIETILLMKDQIQKNFSEIEGLTNKNQKTKSKDENGETE